MNQPSLFDDIVSRCAADARDDALSKVAANNVTDSETFERCALRIIGHGKPFTTDDVLQAFPELESIKEKRVFGSVMLRLCREGMIRPGGYRASDRQTSHARPKRVWVPR